MWSRHIIHTHHTVPGVHSTPNRRMALHARVRGSGSAFPEGVLWSPSIVKSKIVLVDSDGEFQFQVRGWLYPKFEVTCFEQWDGILAELDRIRPDLLILNGRPESPQSLEFIKRLCSDPNLVSLPILWLVPDSQKGTLAACFKKLRWLRLVKPVERRQLLEKISELLSPPSA